MSIFKVVLPLYAEVYAPVYRTDTRTSTCR